MAIELATKYLPYVDEIFAAESKISLLTNKDFSFEGAKTVKIYKISTSGMTDYSRNEGVYRYGEPKDLDATTEECTLTRDRSFTFVVDKLDKDETVGALSAATALARQVRQVVIPEVDTYTYAKMVDGAGTTPEAKELTALNIYDEITAATKVLDDAEVPEEGRIIVVTPDTYRLMKKSKDIVLETEIGADMRKKGVVANLDGAIVVKVPPNRLPHGFGFMMAHPCATCAPVKLAEYRTHQDPPGISGELAEGRICYDAFVLDNKVKAIYYQAIPVEEETETDTTETTTP